MQSKQRICAHTLQPLEAGQGVCVLRGPNGEWIIDFSEKLSDEGVFLSATAEVLEAHLVAQGMSAAEWKQWWPRQQQRASKRLLEWLALVRKSGAMVQGFAKVLEALQSQQVMMLIQARDSGRDADKITLPAQRQQLPILRYWDAQSLGQPIGREHAVHIGLKNSLMSEKFLAECSRLAGFLEGDGL